MKYVFFDERAVRAALDAGTRKALSKFGAYVRRRAKSSIRKRRRISRPGEPPSSHTGKLRKSIYFGYDAQNKSVVVGPTKWSSSNAQALLEYGGRKKTRLYRPRPYMRPAFQKELSNLKSLLTNFVR